MTREFQIRVSNEDGEEFDCRCFATLAEANDVYTKLSEEDTEGATYHLELVEVLRQDEVCIGEPYGDAGCECGTHGKEASC